MSIFFGNNKTVWWFPAWSIAMLSLGFYMQFQSSNSDIAYFNKTDQLLTILKVKYDLAQTNGDAELQKRLIDGFVKINLSADEDELKGVIEFRRTFQSLLLLVIAINVIEIIASIVADKRTKKDTRIP